MLLSTLFGVEIEGAVLLLWHWTQAIEMLVEKEYIKHVDGTQDMFTYVT